jgi:hypothetical protein
MLEKNIFYKIIQQVDEIVNESANDQTKLNHAGNLFDQGSLIILEKAQVFLTLLMMEIDLSWTGDFYESEINITNR